MDECGAALRAGAPDGHVVVARRQSAGRGRVGRAWHSSGDGGLYLSVLLRGFANAAAARGLTLAVGIGVLDAVRTLGVAGATLKWPNDVLVGPRKLAGILTEWVGEGDGGSTRREAPTPAAPSSPGAAIVGIGLNVAQRSFPGELAAIATSIAVESGRPALPDDALATLLAGLEPAVDSFRRDGLAWVVPAWSARSDQWGRRARAGGVEGVLLRLAPEGSLIVRGDDGRESVVTADAVELL
ncbi:MAG: biotin--[acetyl-CoA-carboxylase] ligase [Deltaproteobacteria bacterium]|nr:biotin--[acetyl-CoA-carboxylase] ligase [Deltaproteobacteria bacterium]